MKYSNIVRKESHPWLTNVKICSLFLFIILSACNPLTPNQDALQETLIALGVQQTSLYQTISAPTIAVDELTSIDQSITSTPDQFATQSLSTEASMSIPSSTPDIDVIDISKPIINRYFCLYKAINKGNYIIALGTSSAITILTRF